MEKTYTLSQKGALTLKLWPVLITICCIFLIWAFEASIFGIGFAATAAGIAWWRNGYVPHIIVTKNDDQIEFISFLRLTKVAIKDIHSIVEVKYHKEYLLRHSNGAIAILKSMPDVADLIYSIAMKNPNIEIKSENLERQCK